ncbi:MAG TPA: sulfite exporter TauE/SafE family protein [Pseudomonadales bacterium]|nr:sulfite exporter TauE/SafE family protein [Pseudomonadales bacterium]
MQDYVFTLAGALVGFCVGLTGVGGGSLMTPLLLALGVTPATAIGTDLLYASITKSGGVLVHMKKRTINWRVVGLMSLGSLPFSAATVWMLKTFFNNSNEYKSVLTTSLGLMLMLTALSLIFKPQLQAFHNASPRKNEMRAFIDQHANLFTILMGAALGILVTLSSVGAGAFGVMVLLVLYPRLATISIIGTDVTHAVTLTLIAGLGHMSMGNVDLSLLGKLLLGSLPAIYVGTHLSARLPERVIQPLLGLTLAALSVKFVFY